MGKYKVVGPRAVAGVPPGGTVDLHEASVNVLALIAAGHVEPIKVAARPKPRTAEAAPAADHTEED